MLSTRKYQLYKDGIIPRTIEHLVLSCENTENCDTKNGSAEFKFLDNIENYKFTQEAKIFVNGKAYKGGEFTLNNNTSKQI